MGSLRWTRTLLMKVKNTPSCSKKTNEEIKNKKVVVYLCHAEKMCTYTLLLNTNHMKEKLLSFCMLIAVTLGLAIAIPTEVCAAEYKQLPELTDDTNNPVWYTIKNNRCGKYATYAGEAAKMTLESSVTSGSFFYFTGSSDGTMATVKIHNFNTALLCDETNSWTAAGREWYIKNATDQYNGLSISKNAEFSGWNSSWNNESGAGKAVAYWYADDIGSTWIIEKVTDASTFFDIAALKADAKAKMELMKNAPVLYPTNSLNSYIAMTDATPATNSVKDVVTAYNSIVGGLKAAQALPDGKKIIFDCSRDDKRLGWSFYAKTDSVEAVSDGKAFEDYKYIWTLKHNGDGTYKLYNAELNVYLGSPAQNAKCFTSAASGANYTLRMVDGDNALLGENIIGLTVGSETLHQAGGGGLMDYGIGDAASRWIVKEVVVDIDVHKAAVQAYSTLPYNLQKAYGIIKEGSKYVCNYPASTTQEAGNSTANLLDGNTTTYFHTGYGETQGTGAHWITADLGAATSQFYFYMSPRTQNGNDRPREIVISGSNSADGEFTPIATITTTMDGTNNPYSSGLITSDTPYQYIRFTVNSTSSGLVFFTLSEFYILPATGEGAEYAQLCSDFKNKNIASPDMTEAAQGVIDANEVLAVQNVKTEAQALLGSVVFNDVPALGEYPTAARTALMNVLNSSASSKELEAAFVAIKHSKNVPVFTINGATKDYCKNASIYDANNPEDTKLFFKTTNVYDKTMLWALDIPKTTVEVADNITIYNMGTGRNFWGSNTIRIVETQEAIEDDGIFLFYIPTNGSSMHAQQTGSVIVAYNSQNIDSGSAWKFAYVGNSFDIDALGDEFPSNMPELKTAYTAAVDANYEFGTELGQYHGYEALEVANTAIQAEDTKLYSSTKTEVATAIQGIQAIALNMPEANGFYRFKGTATNFYIAAPANTGTSMVTSTEPTVNTILYWNENKNLLVYNSGHYMNQTNHAHLGYKDTYEIEASKRGTKGSYAIKPASINYLYSKENGLDKYSGGAHANCDWTIEKVAELPITIGEGGYTTFYAPVAVSLPAGLKAYYGAIENEYLVLTEISGTIPQGTAVIIEGAQGTHDLPIVENVEAIADNALEGSIETKNTVANAYTLQNGSKGIGFYGYTGSTLKGFKAYMTIADNSIKGFAFDFSTTGIENVKAEKNTTPVIYDLMGRRVAKAQKGIYVIDGVVTVVK